MIKSEIDTMLNTILGESSTNFYTVEERNLAINQACQEINSETGLLRTVASIAVTPESQLVNLPVDFAGFGQGMDWLPATASTPSRLESAAVMQIRARDPNWTATTGFPSNYIVEGGRVYLYPWPTEAGVLIMSYVAQPNLLVNGADVPFYGDLRTVPYHDLIPLGAGKNLLFKDRDFEASDRLDRRYRERYVDLVEALRRTGDRPNQVIWADPYKE